MTIRHAALWSLASQYASFAIQFAVSVIISRLYLLPADVGLFSIALAAAMMVSILQDLGISRFVTGQPEMRPELLRDYAAVAVGIGWLVAGAIAVMASPFARLYGEPGLLKLMLIIAASYVALPLALVPAAMLTRAMNFRILFLVNAGSALAGGVVAIASAAGGAGPASLAWGMLATALARLIIVQLANPLLPRLPRQLAAVRPLIDFGRSSLVICISGALGMRSQDLIVGHLLGTTATGLFTRASALAGQMSTLVVGSISGVFYPAFARKRDAGEDLAEPYLHLVACNTGAQWAAAVGMALAAEPLVHLLYGPNWQAVAPLLRWTALAEIFFMAIPLQMDIPILLGRIRTLVWINLVDTFLTVVLLAVFCLWGLEAAALSRVAIGAVWFAIYAPFLSGLMRLKPTTLASVYLRSAVCAAAAGVPLLIARALGWFAPDMPFALFAGLCLAGVVCWLVALPLVAHPLWQEVRLGLSKLGWRSPTRQHA